MKYPELKGKCKECKLGCFRLENPEFTGTNECEYKESGLDICKKILQGEQIKIGGTNEYK